MTGNEFKTARKTCLKYTQAEMATAMGLPSKRTVQDIEALGDQDIRGIYARCLALLIERDKWVMGSITAGIDKCAACQYRVRG